MKNFGKYLESKRIVSKKRVPLYVAWVSQFFILLIKNQPKKSLPRKSKGCRGRKAQNIVIHPNDSKCAITALNLANLKS
jgi:hypothetical protein